MRSYAKKDNKKYVVRMGTRATTKKGMMPMMRPKVEMQMSNVDKN